MDLLLFRDRPRPYIPPGSLFKTLREGGRGIGQLQTCRGAGIISSREISSVYIGIDKSDTNWEHKLREQCRFEYYSRSEYF